MAYVKMSGAVIERVEQKISRMCNAETSEVKMPSLDVANDLMFNHAVDLMWGNYKHLKPPVMPEEWCTINQDVVKISKDGRWGDGHSWPTVTARPVTKKGTLPPGFYYHTDNEFDMLPEVVYGPMYPTVMEYIAKSKQRVAISAKWQSIKKQVVEFLKAMPSLNKAIEMQPGLALYLGDEDKERLEAKQDKRTKTEIVAPPMDVEAIISAAVSARMSGVR
jgi:hypothetical protein